MHVTNAYNNIKQMYKTNVYNKCIQQMYATVIRCKRTKEFT